jgi:CBS domain-containing protein
VAAVRSVVLDALIRRLTRLALRDAGEPPALFTWFALGSLARREAVPSSDVDSALAWEAADTGEARRYMTRLARAVDDGLRACGMRPDAHGASASNPQFARSLASWHAAVRSLSENPAREQALVLVSVITDSRPVWSTGPGAPAADALWEARTGPDLARTGPDLERTGPDPARTGPEPERTGPDLRRPLARTDPDLRRLLARFALSFRPPTGFLRDFVVEHSGERRGQLDIKHGGLVPIVDLARWAAMSAGLAAASTTERLRAAEAAGTLEGPQARTLIEAFGFIFALRLDHQVEQLRRGEVPDNFIDPKTLNPLARSYLREAFRAVASVQSGISAELSLGVRWG